MTRVPYWEDARELRAFLIHLLPTHTTEEVLEFLEKPWLFRDEYNSFRITTKTPQEPKNA